MSLSVVLVDDHQMFRETLELALTRENVRVIGTAADAHTGLALIQRVAPDVAVVDISLPGTNGFFIPQELRRLGFASRVLMLTMHLEDRYLHLTYQSGAVGLARKTQSLSELVDAIHQVASGARYGTSTSPPGTVAEADGRTRLDALSRREREVLKHVVEGHTNKEIATLLALSIKTIETHRGNVNRKLGVHSTATLMRLAALEGLIE